jgi:hypothetical protein
MAHLMLVAALAASAAAREPPSLETLEAEWQAYHRGLGHPSDPPEWKAPKHGLALASSGP